MEETSKNERIIRIDHVAGPKAPVEARQQRDPMKNHREPPQKKRRKVRETHLLGSSSCGERKEGTFNPRKLL